MKIQINSLEALERLIGNDNEFELEIRNNIVQKFTKKHLKALVNEDVFINMSKSIKNEIHKEYFENDFRKIKLTKKHSEKMKEAISDLIDDKISKLIKEELEVIDDKIKQQIESAFDHRIDFLYNETVKLKIKNKISSLFND